jgi:hypothetical protein
MIDLISIDHAMIRNGSTNVILHDEKVHNVMVHDDDDVHDVLVDELGYDVGLGFLCELVLSLLCV